MQLLHHPHNVRGPLATSGLRTPDVVRNFLHRYSHLVYFGYLCFSILPSLPHHCTLYDDYMILTFFNRKNFASYNPNIKFKRARISRSLMI